MFAPCSAVGSRSNSGCQKESNTLKKSEVLSYSDEFMTQLCGKLERASVSSTAPLCGKFIQSGLSDQTEMDARLQEIYSKDAALGLINSILGHST